MSIFDKLFQQTAGVRSAAGGVAQNAVKQGKSLAAIGRTKISIATAESEMKEAYTELGRLFYRDFEAGTEASMEDYQPWIDKIVASKAEIEKLNDDIAAARAAAEAPAAPAEDLAEVAEDAEEFVEKVADDVEDAAEDAAEAVEDVAEDVADAAAEAAENVAEAAEDVPVVGTLFVDTTGTEE